MHSRELQTSAISLYDSGISARGVSRELERDFGVSVTPQTIARWMREVGMSRPVGPVRSAELPPEAKRLYESGLTIEQVARQFGVGATVAGQRLREIGAEIRPSGSRFVHLLTRDRLRTLYVLEGRTMRSIADEAGCSIGTVYRLLKRLGVRRRR